MRRLFYLLLFIASLAAGIFFNAADRNREIYRSICDLTEANFYKQGPDLDAWVGRCRRIAAQVPWDMDRKDLVDSIQNLMNELGVSHFQIYSPVEDKKLWTGVAVDTGIRSRFVEEVLVIYKVLAGSAAAEAGVKAGDMIEAISGAAQITPWGAQNRSGTYSLRRRGKPFTAEIVATELETDGGPLLTRLAGETGLLEISSFRSEYFTPEVWRKVVAQMKPYSRLIIDLRENAGGNFVAMLRALSTFFCDGYKAGVVTRPRAAGDIKEAFDDNTEDSFQIDEIAKYKTLGLKTFADYGCFRGPVTVLISSDTSSVAEIFAYSFLHRPGGRVWGQPTAGDVVLAVWYDLPALGEGYSVSIPEAVYLTPQNQELENRGVSPQREIYYDLNEALAGRDTFIERALMR